jgi:hypothetical protein
VLNKVIDMNKLLLVLGIVVLLVGVTACGLLATKISTVKTADNVGKSFTISGTVVSSFKIGSLSGYTLKDSTDTIGVSSQTLPKENTTMTVTGVLMKDTIFGYYIKANE